MVKQKIDHLYVRAMLVPQYLSPQESDNFHKRQRDFNDMIEIKDFWSYQYKPSTIVIPSNGALVIIGTGRGLSTQLSALKDRAIKFQSRGAGALVVTAHLTGSSMFQTGAITASRLVKYAASVPIAPLKGAANTNSSFKAGINTSINLVTALKHPAHIYRSLNAKSFLVVQVASQAASGHPDAILETQGSDFYINDLFNALLASGLIAQHDHGDQLPDEDFGMGGGINF